LFKTKLHRMDTTLDMQAFAPLPESPWCTDFYGRYFVGQYVFLSFNNFEEFRYTGVAKDNASLYCGPELQWLHIPKEGDPEALFDVSIGVRSLVPVRGILTRLPTSIAGFHLWQIQFAKEYIDDQDSLCRWNYEGIILPNGVILGRWSDGTEERDECVEGPFCFFPASKEDYDDSIIVGEEEF